MTDLHTLLYEPWWTKSGADDVCRPPLSTRMPELVEGLEWGENIQEWMLYGHIMPGAEDIFIGRAVKALAEFYRERNLPMPTTPAALAAALHSLCNERDK